MKIKEIFLSIEWFGKICNQNFAKFHSELSGAAPRVFNKVPGLGSYPD